MQLDSRVDSVKTEENKNREKLIKQIKKQTLHKIKKLKMTPKPENTQSYNLEPGTAYVNKGYVNNEKCSVPQLEVSNEVKLQPGSQPRVIDFDDLLPYIGEFGRYQKILFLFMIPFAFFVAFVYFSQIFITLVPDEHWCFVPELANLTSQQR